MAKFNPPAVAYEALKRKHERLLYTLGLIADAKRSGRDLDQSGLNAMLAQCEAEYAEASGIERCNRTIGTEAAH